MQSPTAVPREIAPGYRREEELAWEWPRTTLRREEVPTRGWDFARRLRHRAARPILLLLLGVGLSLASWGVFSSRDSGSAVSLSQLQGFWQEEKGPRVLRIESARIVEFDGHDLVVRGLIRQEGNGLVLRRSGLRENWRAWVDGAVLCLKCAEDAHRYRRVDGLPEKLDLNPKPLSLPPPQPLTPAKVQSIQREITRRFEEEQAVLADPNRGKAAFDRARLGNQHYLRGLLSNVGWIDSTRFDQTAVLRSVILIKHTDNLQLMLTALEYGKADLKKLGKGQTLAILSDAVQLRLGLPQRYGTQFMEDEQGPFILPLENRYMVDTYLKELELPPLSTYQVKVGKLLYNGREVPVRDDG